MVTFIRRFIVVSLLTATLASNGAAHAIPCWHPPSSAPITDAFRDPGCRWCPGNRGIEYGTPAGSPVSAVATGRISYAGVIADVVYVVVRHADGLRTTYGNLQAEAYDVGDLVVRGALVGRTAGRFHFGLREGDRYLDPAPYLGRLVHRPRLIPIDGSRANPAPPPRLRCGGRA